MTTDKIKCPGNNVKLIRGKSPAGKDVDSLLSYMALTFEFVLHFVGYDTVTKSPKQIIIIIIFIIIIQWI